jgi:hypothetical protein
MLNKLKEYIDKQAIEDSYRTELFNAIELLSKFIEEEKYEN